MCHSNTVVIVLFHFMNLWKQESDKKYSELKCIVEYSHLTVGDGQWSHWGQQGEKICPCQVFLHTARNFWTCRSYPQLPSPYCNPGHSHCGFKDSGNAFPFCHATWTASCWPFSLNSTYPFMILQVKFGILFLLARTVPQAPVPRDRRSWKRVGLLYQLSTYSTQPFLRCGASKVMTTDLEIPNTSQWWMSIVDLVFMSMSWT